MEQHSIRSVALAALLGAIVLGCDEEQAPTAPVSQEALPLAASADVTTSVGAMGTIPLPVNQTFNGTALAFGISQTGSGAAGLFRINNSANSGTAILGQTNGRGIAVRGLSTSTTGRAGVFENTAGTGSQDVLFAKSSNSGTAIHAVSNGSGVAGKFEGVRNSGANTLVASAIGIGTAVNAVNTGDGAAGAFFKTSSESQKDALFTQTAGIGDAIEARATGNGTAGHFVKTGQFGGPVLTATANGSYFAASFAIDNTTSPFSALRSATNGTGWAGEFEASSPTGGGVVISTGGGPGLQVFGGSKNAVVKTPGGARALYTEESSEVWFTDYGFGTLENGRARILIDPAFAQTVNLDSPYHVFIQPYGDAELYVKERTNLGFVVEAREGNPNAEFGFRIVAKRSGFESNRLERAPWADKSAPPME